MTRLLLVVTTLVFAIPSAHAKQCAPCQFASALQLPDCRCLQDNARTRAAIRKKAPNWKLGDPVPQIPMDCSHSKGVCAAL